MLETLVIDLQDLNLQPKEDLILEKIELIFDSSSGDVMLSAPRAWMYQP